VTEPATTSSSDLAALLRPSLLRLTRVMRNQRVDMSITLTQLSAMSTLLARGPMSAGDLAGFERVQPPSMTKVLANLEDRGLVVREQHPTDRRQAIIAITDKGTQLLELERRSRDEWLSLRLESLSGAELAILRDVVPVLDRLAEQ
jgi:DNA-binding MarR family transcriptional regulator